MAEFMKEWFKGFEEGISSLDMTSKETVFKECAKRCANTGIIELYKQAFEAADKDFDGFFHKLNEHDTLGGYVIEQKKTYEITFDQCYCDLYREGYVKSDVICECSRQSILYVMQTLNPDKAYSVEKKMAVLSGDTECRFRISVQSSD